MTHPSGRIARFQALALAVSASLLPACGSDGLTLPDQTEPARVEAVSGSNQAGSTGTMLAEPLVVRVTDSEGRPVFERKVAFVLVEGDGEVTPDTALTDADGRATGRWVLGPTEGTQRVEARVIGPVVLVTSFVASAAVGTAARVERVRGDAQTAIAGSALADSLVVRTLDASGQPVGGIKVTWTVTGGGSVSAASTVTGRDGTSGVRRTLGPVAGAQATAAAVQGASGSPVSFGATATVGTAGRLRLEVQPAAAALSGEAFSRQPQVQLIDENANAVPRAGVAVTASIASGPAGATLVGSRTASTNGQGLAVFTDLAISGGGGSYRLNFESPNVVGVGSAAIAVSAGAPSALRIVTQPSSPVQTGAVFSIQPVLQLVDLSGNDVARPDVAVTVAIASGAGTLGGTLTISTDGSGTARFTNLAITGSGGARTLIFAGSGLTSATSAPIEVRAGPSASRSSISAPATLGAGVNGAVAVTVRDDAGIAVSGVAVVLSATGSGNTISPSSVTTSSTGVANFTFKSSVLGIKSLTATTSGVTIGPVQVEVRPGPANANQTIATVPGGRRLQATVILVETRDEFGNPLTTGGASITGVVTDGPNEDRNLAVQDLSNGTYRLTYTPLLTGDDKITIRLSGTQIKGSPFTSKVTN